MGDAQEAAAADAEPEILPLAVVVISFTKGLAEQEANYANQKAAYTTTTKENEITTTAKNQDVKYKSQEITQLTKALSETTADRSGVQTELDAVMEYLDSLHKQCDETVTPYAVTKARRESEIAGLKEALEILEGSGLAVADAQAVAADEAATAASASTAKWQAAAVTLVQKSALRGISRH